MTLISLQETVFQWSEKQTSFPIANRILKGTVLLYRRACACALLLKFA